jgi:taurine dioxygenase
MGNHFPSGGFLNDTADIRWGEETLMQAFDVKPLSPSIGVEIVGLDLSAPFDEETFSALHGLWLEHLVLLFRNQKISEQQQVRFASRFGEPTRPNSAKRFENQPDHDPAVMLIGNIRENGKIIGSLPDGELQFHSDSAFLETPLMATMLYGVDIPAQGGNTLFANCYAAFEAMPAALRNRVAELRAVNVYDYATQVRVGRLDRDKAPFATHPVLRTHPETGKKAIYVNRLMSEEIVGLPETESTDLLNQLFDLVECPEHCYEHVWQQGDLILWDNRCVQHARTDFPPEERRLLKRVGLIGDQPA